MNSVEEEKASAIEMLKEQKYSDKVIADILRWCTD